MITSFCFVVNMLVIIGSAGFSLLIGEFPMDILGLLGGRLEMIMNLAIGALPVKIGTLALFRQLRAIDAVNSAPAVDEQLDS